MNQNTAAMPQDQVVVVNVNTNRILLRWMICLEEFMLPSLCLNSIEFLQISKEYFMIKLCQICDKANVPHHIVDDVVDLLRDCKRNNINIQPEHLRKSIHFLKHLAN